MEKKINTSKKGTNEYKLFKYLQSHKSVTSRDSKYPPLEIMDLPKLISNLIYDGYSFTKIARTRINSEGVKKRYVEYFLNEEVKLVNE